MVDVPSSKLQQTALRLWGAVLAIGLMIQTADFAGAQQIDVTRGQAITVDLDGTASTVILGDDAIADATVAFADTVVVIGREPGSTNLIVFDAAGNELYNAVVSVSPAFDNTQPIAVLGAGHRLFLDCTPVYCVSRREPDTVIESTSEVTSDNGATQTQTGTSTRREF